MLASYSVVLVEQRGLHAKALSGKFLEKQVGSELALHTNSETERGQVAQLRTGGSSLLGGRAVLSAGTFVPPGCARAL